MSVAQPTAEACAARAEELFGEQRHALHRQTDRMFAGLMACQWPATIAAALLLSPRSWSGSSSSLHPNVYLAVFLGGLLAALPVSLALRQPGEALTRHVIALCQALTSALLIHVSGGRIETHFHIFGSLAFLSFYRDWRVLVTASVAVAADHMLRGIYAPASVFGVLSASSWRWVEHALWVVFEDAFLFYSCWRSTNEMRAIAARQALLEATKDDVERQVVERSSELAHARDAAVDASRVKSEFLANMSHEIRTPMNGILGMTAFLEETEMSAEQREYAHTVRTCSEALMTVIDDILDFSKIEAGKIELESAEFEPCTVVEEVLDILAARAAGKGFELVSALAPDLPEVVRGDPGRLRQVLLNFAGNAVKFTAQGEVVIAAELVSEDAGQVVLRFEVRDTGIGIPPERMDRLFRSFSQVDSSHTRRFGGSGLGLVIAKRLVELMGGTVGVESTEGKGSRFWFTVALQRGAHASAGRAELLAHLRDQRVLVVDDNATNREVFTRQLRAWGCFVQAVEGPRRALEVLRTAAELGAPFDLGLLDFQMPEMDGLELAAAIRGTPELARMQLLLLTSVGGLGLASGARELELAAVLTKPVRARSLQNALLDALARAAPAAAEPSPALPGAREPLSAGHERGRVLIAEDNPVNQRVAQLMLQRLGCSADVVANGAEALVALERTRYDLIFMDCQMPVLDGFEATQRIRLREVGGRRTPIVATTAYATRGDRERCLAAGMDDYLDKPLRKEALVAALERWLANAPSRVEPKG